jgi:sortase A
MRRVVRSSERVLCLAGTLCLLRASLLSLEGAAFQQRTAADIRRDIVQESHAAPDDGVVGLLEIPRVGLSTVVVQGDDTDTLRVAAGHLPDTPLPWEPGHSAIAGHRDTFFRALRAVQVGDVVELVTRRGRLSYQVLELMVVEPEDVWVLAPSSAIDLTLITCYPFSYVGSAPHRFIVRAARRVALTRG